MIVHPAVDEAVASHPYPLLFATISGAHLYGFPSPDSDYDVRGVHVLRATDVVGLDRGPATIEKMSRGEPEIDLVTHDVEKFFQLLLRPNGYVLEQLYSPLIISTTPAHDELKNIARDCVTRMHARHYCGFAENQWKLFLQESPPRVKPLLYVFRVLLTGIHLMRTGVVEANLVMLNGEFRLPFVESLIARKTMGERVTIEDIEVSEYQREYERLLAELMTAGEQSKLPEHSSARAALNDLLIRLRLRS